MKVLNHIIDKTDAKIVISSTWRKGRTLEQLREIFTKVGFTGEIIDKTPSLFYSEKSGCTNSVPRGCEIEEWMRSKYGYLESVNIKYVILDDDSDMLLSQRENYFRVDGYCGITPNLAYRVINFLNRYDSAKLPYDN